GRHVESFLIFEKHRDVLKEFPLGVRCIRGFCCLPRVFMHVQRKIAYDESNLVSVGLQNLFQHGMHCCTSWALKISELNYRYWRVCIAASWVIIDTYVLNRLGRLGQQPLDFGVFSKSG